MTEMLGYNDDPVDLPDWLRPDKELPRRTMRSGNKIANIVLGAFEVGLQVPRSAITDAHRIEDPSDDLLRYPGLQAGQPCDDLRFAAHKDFTSFGILFTWVGGLQLPALDVTPSPEEPLHLPEDQW
jgi:isopenicillin N synthase-like dioxygenase